jgi:hypothetical protein
MNLTFRRAAIGSAFVCFSLALTWTLIPDLLLFSWGVEFSDAAALVGRGEAVMFAGIGIVFFSARDAEPSSIRDALVAGFVFSCCALAALGVFEYVTGHAGPGILSAVVVEIALALALLLGSRKKPALSYIRF